MKKRVFKMVAVLTAVIMVTSNAPTASADTVTNGDNNFEKAWEISILVDDGQGVLTYGYNTLFFNEDYSHAYHSDYNHYAFLKNENGAFSGSNKKAGKWSKIEVIHNGTSITYGIAY